MLTSHDIAKMLDHSTLQPNLTPDAIARGCEIALRYDVASVCARPADMAQVAAALRGSDVHVCTVIGFPHGAHRTEVKAFEAERALDDGCSELDMVLNIGRLIAGDADYVARDIRAVCEAAEKRGAIVKVILETCYLTDDQKRLACRIAADAGAAFVKTSTGYGSAGCTLHDLRLMREATPAHVRVKGSGGIRTLDTVLAARALGASRCGVSATEKIMTEALAREAAGTLQEADPAALDTAAPSGAY